MVTITCNTTIRNILLAEDDPDDSFIFRDALQEINPGLKLEIVPNGTALMSLLHRYSPDLLFLDLDMPYKNGLECLVEMRNTPALKDLPVVVFSATSRPVNIRTAYEMGAHLFLIKSPLYGEYKEAIRAILQLDWSNPERIKQQYCRENTCTTFSATLD